MSAPGARILPVQSWTAASACAPGPSDRRLTFIDATDGSGDESGLRLQGPDRVTDRSGTTGLDRTMASLVLASLAFGIAPPTSASPPGFIPLWGRPVNAARERWPASSLAPPVATWQEDILSRLHARSLLTWEQIARLMGVDRRTIHLWLTGTQPRGPRAERLSRVMQVVDGFGSLTPEEIRGRLLQPGDAGQPSLFEVLVAQAAGASVPVQLEAEAMPRATPREASLVKWLGASSEVVAAPRGRALRRAATREPRRG